MGVITIAIGRRNPEVQQSSNCHITWQELEAYASAAVSPAAARGAAYKWFLSKAQHTMQLGEWQRLTVPPSTPGVAASESTAVRDADTAAAAAASQSALVQLQAVLASGALFPVPLNHLSARIGVSSIALSRAVVSVLQETGLLPAASDVEGSDASTSSSISPLELPVQVDVLWDLDTVPFPHGISAATAAQVVAAVGASFGTIARVKALSVAYCLPDQLSALDDVGFTFEKLSTRKEREVRWNVMCCW